MTGTTSLPLAMGNFDCGDVGAVLSGGVYRNVLGMNFEDWPDEWQEWARLTPIERFRESEKIFAQYLAMGGSLDPDPQNSI